MLPPAPARSIAMRFPTSAALNAPSVTTSARLPFVMLASTKFFQRAAFSSIAAVGVTLARVAFGILFEVYFKLGVPPSCRFLAHAAAPRWFLDYSLLLAALHKLLPLAHPARDHRGQHRADWLFQQLEHVGRESRFQ